MKNKLFIIKAAFRCLPVALLALAAAIVALKSSAQVTLTLEISPPDEAIVQFNSDPASYFILERNTNLTLTFDVPVDLQLGVAGTGTVTDTAIPSIDGFYRILQVPLSSPLDVDGDGDDDTFELARPGLFDPLNPDDPFRHPNPSESSEISPASTLPSPFNPYAATLADLSDSWANGILLHSGESVHAVTDLHIRGRAIDFTWARRYRSRHSADSALGYSWDFSYNIFIEPDQEDLLLHNGMARIDRFASTASNLWESAELFQTITVNTAGVLMLMFPDQTEWSFDPLNGDNQDGKITSINDRNGNAMLFEYDENGRLEYVIDDLGRTNTCIHTNSVIVGVVDYSGRQVTYDYYEAGDAGGSAGDLKSVTSPVVTNTPTGNDFPSGKTTLYTYTKGFADEQLNHNLLTITDPKGQAFLTYEYAVATNVLDYSYDRVVRQTWGDPGDTIDLTYQLVTPTISNNHAVTRTILNDREGHVKHLFFDAHTRGVLMRELTGLADPDLPTTVATNLPGPPLHPSDPSFCETRWDYNELGLILTNTLPNQSKHIFVYDAANPDPRLRANLLQRIRLPGPLGGDQPQLVETFEYDSDFGGGCGRRFVTRHVDARGNESLHEYDSVGNRTSTTGRVDSVVFDYEYEVFGRRTAVVHPDNGTGHRRRDEFSYYLFGTQAGYLEQHVIDVTGEAITNRFEYNPRGFLTRIVDGLGNDTLYSLNALDQVVRQQSRVVETDNGPVRYETDFHYDGNGNVVRIDTLNISGDGMLSLNSQWSDFYLYDILNTLTNVNREVSPVQQLVTEFEYDANRNRVLMRSGEAVNGNDPANTVTRIYDERDLVFQTIRASGDADQSTSEYDYDTNRNLVETRTGIEDEPRVYTYVYDGYDRCIGTTDPMGNEATHEYDANGNRVSRRVDGELDDQPGSTGNLRMVETDWTYDGMDRCIARNRFFFDPVTQNPIGDGFDTTTWRYAPTSLVLAFTNDNAHAWTYAYDSVNRLAMRSDPASNTVAYTYDANDNIVQMDETDVSTAGSSNQQFTTTYTYDGLDRRIVTEDNRGNTTRYVYDSRDLVVVTEDPLSNVVTFAWDGLDRLRQTSCILTSAPPVVTQYQYDDNSRLVNRMDANTNVTQYGYDSLDRRIQIVHADGTSESCTYDAHGNRIGFSDANGTMVEFDFDLLGRQLTNNVTVFGSGVNTDVSTEIYGYDGLSRLVRADNEESQVQRAYDSLSRRVSETQDGQATLWTYDAVGNMLTTIYPGGRVVARTYDAAERLQSIHEGGLPLVQFDYVGSNRREQMHFGNGTRVDYTYDGLTGVPDASGDHGVKCVSSTLHTNLVSTNVIDHREYRYDAAQNIVVRQDVRAGAASERMTHDYIYDELQRLVRTIVQDHVPVLRRDEQYQLDGMDNRLQVIGGYAPGPYFRDPANPPADFQMNQYTETPIDLRQYDLNGNLVDQNTGDRQFVYDYRNRIVEINDNAAGQVHQYAYDALGRRVERRVAVGEVVSGPATRYFYDGSRVIEEQPLSPGDSVSFILGPNGSEPLCMRVGTNDFFYHADTFGSTMALTDGAGNVVDRHEYGDFGLVVDPINLNPVPGHPSAVQNHYLFGGMRFDPESGLYFDDCWTSGYFDPLTGRYIGGGPGWVFETDEPVIPLGPDDCPVTSELRLEPVVAGVGSRSGSLHLIEFTGGAKQPSTLTADVAQSLFYGTSYLYGSGLKSPGGSIRVYDPPSAKTGHSGVGYIHGTTGAVKPNQIRFDFEPIDSSSSAANSYDVYLTGEVPGANSYDVYLLGEVPGANSYDVYLLGEVPGANSYDLYLLGEVPGAHSSAVNPPIMPLFLSNPLGLDPFGPVSPLDPLGSGSIPLPPIPPNTSGLDLMLQGVMSNPLGGLKPSDGFFVELSGGKVDATETKPYTWP